MGFYRGPNIVTDGLIYAIDAGSERSYPRLTPPAVWYDYTGGLAAGRYSIVNSVQPYAIRLNTSFASWVGYYRVAVPSAENYTIMFDYVADASSSLTLDNDGIDDNNWNATFGVTTTVQTYKVTKAVTTTGNIDFFTKRNSGGNITVSNFRFFKSDPVFDLVGTTNGTLTNGVVFNANNGGTWDFDGVDDFINIPNYTAHQQSTGTMEAWINPDVNTSNRYQFSAGSTSPTLGATRALRILNGKFSFVGYGSGNVHDWNDIVAAPVNVWQHVAIGWNGTTAYFYLNGVGYNQTLSGLITPTGTLLKVGGRSFSSSGGIADGEIASLKSYSTLLTEAQIKQNFNAQKSRFGL